MVAIVSVDQFYLSDVVRAANVHHKDRAFCGMVFAKGVIPFSFAPGLEHDIVHTIATIWIEVCHGGNIRSWWAD